MRYLLQIEETALLFPAMECIASALKGVELHFTSKYKGSIALAHVLSYFSEKGYHLFLPMQGGM